MHQANTRSIDASACGYSAAFADAARAQLREHLPRLIALRLDRARQSGVDLSRVHLHVRGNKSGQPCRIQRVQCAAHHGWNGNKLLASCLHPYLRDAASLRPIENALEMLRGCNPYGGWAIDPDPTPEPLVIGAGDAAITDPRITSSGALYLREVVGELGALLPSIARIIAETTSETDARQQRRRRTWLRCLDHVGHERAAIESSLLATQLRTAIAPNSDEHHGLNSARQSWWEEQLGIARMDLPVVLHALYLIFNTLNVDAVALD